ncbi:MAG: hypothetical protein R3B07_13515 [Polyangiaceae bacterium]
MTFSFFRSFSGSCLPARGVLFASLLLAGGCGGSSSSGSGGSGATAGSAGDGGSAGSATTGGAGNAGGDAGMAGVGGAGATGGGQMGGAGGAQGGSAGTGGAAGAGTGGTGGMECVEQMGTGGFMQPACSDLDRLVVRNPRLDPSGGITPGSKATFRVDLTDVSGYGFNYYPGVDFESDTQGVTVTDEQFFAVLPCGTNETLSNVEIDPSVPSGTEVTISATVTMLNQQCSGTDSVSYKFTVLAP